MGILTKLASKTLVKVAENVVETKTIDYLDENHSVKGALKKGKMNNKLIVKRKLNLFGKKFYILDESNNKKYILQREFNSVKLFDKNNLEIGEVISHKDLIIKQKFYCVYLRGNKLGEIHYSKSFKTRLDVKFNNWKIEGDLLHYHFTVFNKNNINIIKIHNAYDRNDYVMEYDDISDEIMGLLMLMSIELMKD